MTTSDVPRWITPTLRAKPGQDPLGLLSMTQDWLIPQLLPGILEQSQIARYFSFHAFVLDEYRRRGLPPDNDGLSQFVLHSEWDLGLAVQRCPRRCGSGYIGARRLRADGGRLGRGESVETYLGGYGLFYRSPMVALGLVAPRGTLLGEDPIPVDVLRPDSVRASRLAEEFRAAVGHTRYVQEWMGTGEPLPLAVVEEYAEQACLCRIAERPTERDAVFAALFTADPVSGGGADTGRGLARRRASAAHFLAVLDADPRASASVSAFRRAAWAQAGLRGPTHEDVADRWAALIAKDVWQEALCSIWSDFCHRGNHLAAEQGRGLSTEQVRKLIEDLLDGPPRLDPGQPLRELVDTLRGDGLAVADDDRRLTADTDLEDLRLLTVEHDTATSGLVVILALVERAATRAGAGWSEVLSTASAWQPSVATSLRALARYVTEEHTVAEGLSWLLENFVVWTHERIAYSKLPDNTFRFRWEDGLLRFYPLGERRFPLAAIRHTPLRRLTHDLGLWQDGASAALTPRGRRFVAEVLG